MTLRHWKSAGIKADLKLKEYGAYIATTVLGKFERMATGLFGPAHPRHYLYNYYAQPDQNTSSVNDPKSP